MVNTRWYLRGPILKKWALDGQIEKGSIGGKKRKAETKINQRKKEKNN